MNIYGVFEDSCESLGMISPLFVKKQSAIAWMEKEVDKRNKSASEIWNEDDEEEYLKEISFIKSGKDEYTNSYSTLLVLERELIDD